MDTSYTFSQPQSFNMSSQMELLDIRELSQLSQETTLNRLIAEEDFVVQELTAVATHESWNATPEHIPSTKSAAAKIWNSKARECPSPKSCTTQADVDDFLDFLGNFSPEAISENLSILKSEAPDAIVPTSASWNSFLKNFESKEAYAKVIQRFANYCAANNVDFARLNEVESALINFFDYCFDSGK